MAIESTTPLSTEQLNSNYTQCQTNAAKVDFLSKLYTQSSLDKDTLRWMQPRVSSLQSFLSQNFYTSRGKHIERSRIILNRINEVATGVSSLLHPPTTKRSRPESQSTTSSSSSSTGRSVIARGSGDLAVHTVATSTAQVEITSLERAELQFFDNLCNVLDEPNQSKESIEKILRYFFHFLKTCHQDKKRIAFKIAEIHSQQKYGIENLDEATKYYQMAHDAGCEKSLGRLIWIANKQQNHEPLIRYIQNLLQIPSTFLNKEISSKGIALTFNDENDKTKKLKLLKLLAKTFSDKHETVIETRLLDLAANLGDTQIKEYLKDKITKEHESQIKEIQDLNNSFFTYAKSAKHHQVNFARENMMSFFKILEDQGYIFTSKELFRPLFVQICAYEALSRYSCFTNSKCQESSCSSKGIDIGKTVFQMDPGHSLAAWVLVALNRISQKDALSGSEIDLYAAIAQAEGQYSDPRVHGATLYQTTSQPSCSSSLTGIYDDIAGDYLGDL